MRLDVSARAQRDIDALHVYGVEQFGSRVADEYVRGQLDLFELLERNPLMGMQVMHFSKKTRRLYHNHHTVFYRVFAKSVRIVRVAHCKQNWYRLL